MKISELKQLIKEAIEKSVSLSDFNPKDIYDFGGSWDPLPGTTVVDIEDKDEEFDHSGEWIVANLEKFIKLPPKKVIHLGDSLNYFYTPQTVKTIHNALLPSGYIFYRGPSQDIYDLFKDLSKLGKYKAISWNPNEDEDDIEEILDYYIIKKIN